MTKTRFAQLLKCQTALARKVFDVVPVRESWSFATIQAELFRQGINKPKNVVEGCLGCLVDAGLVLKGSKGLFIRVSVTEKTEAAPEGNVVRAISPPQIQYQQPEPGQMTTKPIINTSAKPTPATTTIFERLTALQNVASDLAERLIEMSDEIDKATQQLRAEAVEHSNELVKLTQLKELLKGL